MDRIFSARIDPAVFQKINDLSVKMHTTKKAIIEQAIRLLGQHYERETETNVFDETCGSWERAETLDETVAQVRGRFRESMQRNRR